MVYLTREAILNADDLTTEVVEVPEWNGSVLVRALTGRQRDQFEGSIVELRGKATSMKYDNIRAKLVALSVIDPTTKGPLFTSADLDILGTKSAAPLDRIFSVAQRLSGLTKEDVDELVKNSGTDPSGTSTIA